ncbi:hypothetical protein BTN49_2923 [Candidatus Enterovibrio escicola]|uniref:Uncharacterized protein n=1 Tax=Candidatus Enterovibrio escicola TaxID=1927127 RepID=A0A2A5SZP5_9GAMM|nr:hypothetical protein BTN49_2923 [Candidatus Enterovibrio escacola]
MMMEPITQEHPINEAAKALKEDKLADWKRTELIINAY